MIVSIKLETILRLNNDNTSMDNFLFWYGSRSSCVYGYSSLRSLVGVVMNERIKMLADQAKESVPKGILAPDLWIVEYNRILAELVAEECAQICMSQADRKNIRRAFGLPVLSDVKYPGADAHWSVTSQYDREYNLPDKVNDIK